MAGFNSAGTILSGINETIQERWKSTLNRCTYINMAALGLELKMLFKQMNKLKFRQRWKFFE
jgi:hypothetical protein